MLTSNPFEKLKTKISEIEVIESDFPYWTAHQSRDLRPKPLIVDHLNKVACNLPYIWFTLFVFGFWLSITSLNNLESTSRRRNTIYIGQCYTNPTVNLCGLTLVHAHLHLHAEVWVTKELTCPNNEPWLNYKALTRNWNLFLFFIFVFFFPLCWRSSSNLATSRQRDILFELCI